MKEDNIIIKIKDKIKRYEKNGQETVTYFLDPLERLEIQKDLKNIDNCFFGGYENSERRILGIGIKDEEELKKYVEVFKIKSKKKLSHREILGSVLGLGIKREVIGDILISENVSYIFVTKDISNFIFQNLEKIGKEKIEIEKINYIDLKIIEEEGKEIKTTVASLRLDAIISAGIGVSREISSKLVQNQKVKCNYKIVENASKQIKEGDMVSVRGYGRIILETILGESKKSRIRIILKKF